MPASDSSLRHAAASSVAGWRAFRHKDPALERLDPGFSLALDALAMVEMSIARTLGGRKPACRQGCAACCVNQLIPASPLELMLLHAHIRLHSRGLRSRARSGAVSNASSPIGPCPFWTKGGCTVYAVRPIGCRQFLVFNRVCRPDEDAQLERPQECFVPDYAAMNAALLHTLPWYAAWKGYPGNENPAEGVRFLRSVTTIIQAVDWGFAAE